MGQSASADIFFGVSYGEDDPRWVRGEDGWAEPPDAWDEDDDNDWEEWLIKLAGWTDPYDDPIVETMPERAPFSPNRSYAEITAEHEAARAQWDRDNQEWVDRRDAYWAAKKAAVDACPVKLERDGYEYGSKYLIIPHSQFGVYDYGGDKIPPDLFDRVTQEQIDAATAWCTEHDIDWSDPAWLLSASYG